MAALLCVAALAIGARPANTQAIQDSRCYLMNGGAVESFFISEDTPVGSIIGTLGVNGDPSDTGDITLKLQERNAAVAIAAGSKNLTLLRALDREERTGPASVYVNVRCDRRHTADPSFVIPVSVRVWDVNDNAPAWRGAPFRARVSELAAPGARVLAAPATDPDQAGPHATVRYSVLPSPHSDYVGFLSELDSTVVVKKPLDYERVRNFTVTLRAQDSGNPPLYNDTTLTVEVLDADDQNPKFTYDHYTAVLLANATEGTILETSPGPISAADQDVGINAPLYYEAREEGGAASAVRLLRDSGAAVVTERLLAHALPLTVVIKATQVDNPDRYALATLTIRRGEGGVRFTRRVYSISVPEDSAPGTVLAALTTRAGQHPLQFYVSERSFLEKFAINSAGEVVLRKTLDYEEADSYYYQVMVTDGNANDTASINITVVDVNEWEPRFRHAHYEFAVEAAPGGEETARGGPGGAGEGPGGAGEGPGGAGGGPGDDVGLRAGRLQAFDGDTKDRLALHLSGPDARYFFVNDVGEVFLKRSALATLNSSVLHVVATATDSGSPPRQSSVPVSVRVGRVESGAGAEAGAGRAVLAGLAAALALLALALLALFLYLCRLRKRQVPEKSAVVAVSGGGGVRLAANGAGEKGGGRGGGGGGGGGGSLLSVSAGASSILAASCSSLELQPGTKSQRSSVGKNRVSPSGGRIEHAHTVGVPTSEDVVDTGVGAARLSEHVGGVGAARLSDHVSGVGAGRSGVAWPSATIPARVKKLSWDDTAQENEHREVNEATNAAVADHMNLTVYF